MNNAILKERLQNFFGESFIIKTADNQLDLDITEPKISTTIVATPCTLHFKNADNFIAINVDDLDSLDKIFEKTDLNQILVTEYSKSIKTLKKKCDAIVIAELNNQLIINIIEYKESIGNRTLCESIFPQLDISCIKLLWIFSLLFDENWIKQFTVHFFMVGRKKLPENEINEQKMLLKNKNPWDLKDFEKFIIGKTIVKDIPFVLNKKLLNSSFQRQKVKVFHKEINAEIDISELN